MIYLPCNYPWISLKVICSFLHLFMCYISALLFYFYPQAPEVAMGAQWASTKVTLVEWVGVTMTTGVRVPAWTGKDGVAKADLTNSRNLGKVDQTSPIGSSLSSLNKLYTCVGTVQTKILLISVSKCFLIVKVDSFLFIRHGIGR